MLVIEQVNSKGAKGSGGPFGDECKSFIAFHGSQDPCISGSLANTCRCNNDLETCIAYLHECSIRRLTPRECERLQGFPDNYTAIHYRGKPASDLQRYKALGNSMAVPVMRWIGERIAEVEVIPQQRKREAE
jgi:DNA (cytosine-5)-methyltransferase 1